MSSSSKVTPTISQAELRIRLYRKAKRDQRARFARIVSAGATSPTKRSQAASKSLTAAQAAQQGLSRYRWRNAQERVRPDHIVHSEHQHVFTDTPQPVGQVIRGRRHAEDLSGFVVLARRPADQFADSPGFVIRDV